MHDSALPGSRFSPAGWFPFDETDIRRCLRGAVDKGRPYQRRGAVRDLRADKGGQRLIASVQGTRLRPYRVFVDIGKDNPVSLSARCSCPAGSDRSSPQPPDLRTRTMRRSRTKGRPGRAG